MQFLENEIRKYLDFVWSSMDLKVEPDAGNFREDSKSLVAGSIQINGAWDGVIALIMESTLAHQISEKMFFLEKGQATEQEIEDAVSEMTNMIGGNLKALLPQPSYLSLPVVEFGKDNFNIPSTELKSKVYFQTEGHKLMVTIHQTLEKESQKEKQEESFHLSK